MISKMKQSDDNHLILRCQAVSRLAGRDRRLKNALMAPEVKASEFRTNTVGIRPILPGSRWMAISFPHLALKEALSLIAIGSIVKPSPAATQPRMPSNEANSATRGGCADQRPRTVWSLPRNEQPSRNTTIFGLPFVTYRRTFVIDVGV